MASFNRGAGPCRRRRQSAAVPELPVRPAGKEPAMRRWRQTAPAPAASQERVEAQLHSLSCALERQTRLLLELQELIKARCGSEP